MFTLDNNLAKIIQSLKSSYGLDFFNSLTLQLNQLIEADYTFIARLDKKKHISRTISLAAKGQIVENFEYALAGTPCADVSEDSVCIYPNNICQLYPDDQLLIDMNIEGYLGTPLHDSQGSVIGIVVALYQSKIENGEYIAALFELFSGRISAEIEREDKEQQLIEFNLTLENKVKLRTKELSDAIETLRLTQEKLIEQEKMASLGNLVAGVAHEINTPLGVAILSSSTIKENFELLKEKFVANKLTKSDLERGLNNSLASEKALSYNLQRAASLVEHFKDLAVEVNTNDASELNVAYWLDSLINSLTPMLKKKNIKITFSGDNLEQNFSTFPSKISQVVTNIISNSATHAFENNRADLVPAIHIEAKIIQRSLIMSISDNGQGMSDEVQQHMFDPFYTTKRGKGGTGLGLNIVKNIVVNNLQGELKATSALAKGTTFELIVPSLKLVH